VYVKYTVNTGLRSLALRPVDKDFATAASSGKTASPAPLGINTKSTSPPPLLKIPETQYARGLRTERYNLQTSIKSLFVFRGGFDQSVMTIENYNSLPRVVKCHSVRIKPTVDVKKNPDHDRAFYSGLAVCGSVWDCPICSARILEKRREEIALAVQRVYENGHKVVMVTFTTPHYVFQTCEELLGKFSKALNNLKSGKAWDKYKKSVDWQGSIRGLETLYGANGWHNHTHELWIVSKNLDFKTLETKVLDRWYKACDKLGLIPEGKQNAFMSHAVDVVDNASASDYLAKHDNKKNLSWGVDKELTKPFSKASKELLHPFQLADISAQGIAGTSKKAGDLFAEYSKAFKGKSSVFWSRGLKQKLGLVEKDDEELAKQETEKIDVLSSLEHHAWSVIKNEKLRSKLLDIAEESGAEGIESLLRLFGVSSVPSYCT
jgi:hypothetical protein